MELPAFTGFFFVPGRLRTTIRLSRVTAVIVAGTALAFYAAAMFIIERESAAT
jgi:phage shock protein PspC (stress-responsive transcriptional regulator)